LYGEIAAFTRDALRVNSDRALEAILYASASCGVPAGNHAFKEVTAALACSTSRRQVLETGLLCYPSGYPVFEPY
jgi:hypothetical protein